MDYLQFKQIEKLTFKMLACLDILREGHIIIRIDNTPDHEISAYRREEETDYYFKNVWDFKQKFCFLIEFDFWEIAIYDYATLQELGGELDIGYDENNPCDLLTTAFNKDKESFLSRGFDIDSDFFKLRNIRVRSIDNIQKKLEYEGAFLGNNTSYDEINYSIYSVCRFIAMPLYKENRPFYYSLLAESYVLLLNRNLKLSFFIAYSALENFVYAISPAAEGSRERFNDKLKGIFANKFGEITSHPIYTRIIGDLIHLTDIRNAIAHGRDDVNVLANDARSMIDFVLALIITFDQGFTSFDQIENYILTNTLKIIKSKSHLNF